MRFLLLFGLCLAACSHPTSELDGGGKGGNDAGIGGQL
jgi:hypothetical protein